MSIPSTIGIVLKTNDQPRQSPVTLSTVVDPSGDNVVTISGVDLATDNITLSGSRVANGQDGRESLHINCDIDEGGRRRREEVRFSRRRRRESEDSDRRSMRRRVDDAPGGRSAYRHS